MVHSETEDLGLFMGH